CQKAIPRGSSSFPFALPKKIARDGKTKSGDDRCSRSALPRKRHPLPDRSRELFCFVGRPAEGQRLYSANQTGPVLRGARNKSPRQDKPYERIDTCSETGARGRHPGPQENKDRTGRLPPSQWFAADFGDPQD